MQPTESAQCRSSSSSASATGPRRSMGCMAGLLRLLSPYHRHRKRLTAKNATPEASSRPPSPPPAIKKPAAPTTLTPPKPKAKPQQQPPTGVRRRRSCEAPRSPTIAPEYRRVSCDSPRPPPPAIVARLMGLEESAPPSPATTPRPRPLPTRPPPPPPPEMAAEKRRRLLGALEKCDDDLQTLRRIIAAVRAAEMRSAAASDVPAAPAAEACDGGTKWIEGRDEPSTPPQQKPRAEGPQYPSPNSVLDAITSPRFPCRKRSSPCTHLEADSKPSCGNQALGSRIVKPSRTLVFSGDYCKIKQYCNELHAVAMYHHPAPVAAVEGMPRWTPSVAEADSWRHRRRWGLHASGRSRAMVESVGEVWGQGAGEERWEAGLVGAALERAILQDLVWDVVAELLPMSGRDAQAPFGGAMCRKRLCF
ncbi:SH3 domain-containing protein C23A1.17-like [Lolium rigidum]|uniref:SH3 domain-containing protein C23A1.17-like n=1 Tax=Lolium rigidum TaxID=89674 RepID=UPI001F5CAC98|nr:SH3 domain-containing protein C23A1.17-like [Lolium rigidum]